MEELFGKFFYLIPIALVVFRVLTAAIGSAAKKKREEEKAAEKKTAPAPVPKKAPAVSRPHWEESPKPPVQQKPKAAPKSVAKKTAAPRKAVQPERLNLNAQPIPSSAVAPSSLGGGGGAAQNAPVSRGLSAESAPPLVIKNLPPLQAAFVWSEIFGTPVGLR